MTTSLPGPGVARIHGAVLTGIHAEIIQVQATVAVGAPGFAGHRRARRRHPRDA